MTDATEHRGARFIRPRTAGSKKYPMKAFNIPAAMGRGIPDDACFTCEFTDEGILFRFEGCFPQGGVPNEYGETMTPSWASENGR